MIEIEIFKDIKDQKAKLIGPFTGRQLVCAAGLALACILGYKGAQALFGPETSLKIFFPMIGAIPFALLGWYEPYGMPFEQYAKNLLYTYILPPKTRLYKTQNLYETFEDDLEIEEAIANGESPQKAAAMVANKKKKSSSSKGKSAKAKKPQPAKAKKPTKQKKQGDEK